MPWRRRELVQVLSYMSGVDGSINRLHLGVVGNVPKGPIS